MAVETYDVESWTTGEVTPRERADLWSEQVAAYHGRLDLRFTCSDDFRGGAIRQRTDTYQLVKYWSEKIDYIRTPHQVRQEPDENYRLLVPRSGQALIRQDGQEARLAPGTGALVTFAAPFESLHDASGFILTIPAREVDSPLSRSSPLAVGLDLTSGLGRVVGDMLTNLHEERSILTSSQFNAVSDRLVELLCLLAVGDDRPTAPGHLAEVEATVRRYIREHAAEPELTGETVAHALGWSPQQVQLALQRVETTPRELIREERLRLVRDRLKNPAYRHMTIMDLAYASGFSTASALHIAFRQHFGMSPYEMLHAGGIDLTNAASCGSISQGSDG